MPALQPDSPALSAHREALYEATDGPVEPRSTKPRNHLAIAQLSSSLNISLGLKRAVDAAALGAVVRQTLRPACAVYCRVCKSAHLWSELRQDGVMEYEPETLQFATCGAGNTMTRAS